MIIFKSFKYQFKINKIQQAEMKDFAGSCRFVWNKALAMQKESLAAEHGYINYSKMAALLVDWKQQEDTSFLKDVHSQILRAKAYGFGSSDERGI